MDGIDFKNVITAAELVRLQWRPHGWVLWQMIPQGGITLLAGETASGKSFLGLDLALGMASGRGKAWDMELGEMEQSTQQLILSPLLGEGRRSRGEGKLCTPTTPSFPSALLRGSSTTASGPQLPLIPSHRARRVSRALLRGDLAFDTNNGDLTVKPRARSGDRHDQGLPSFPSALLRGSSTTASDESLSPLLGEGRRSRGEGKVEPEYPSSTASGSPSPRGRLKETERSEPGLHESRVRYFCGDADPNLVAERVLRLCRGYPNDKKGEGIDVPEALDLDFTAHAFSDPESFTWLQKEVTRRGYDLLIFDGLSQYLPGMADGSASAVGTFLRGLRHLTSQTGVSVLLIHQFNKRQAARLDKWGLPTSQGEERVRGSSELLAGVDSVLLLSRPEAMKLGGMGRTVLKVVKNRLGQAGARLQFTIVDGEGSLHLLFERLGAQAQPKPRRLVDAAFDALMQILMTEDERKFDRAELTKLLQERMNLPPSRSLTDAFRFLGKDERVRIERDDTGKKRYSWAIPGTGAMEKTMYGLPPTMALDFASSYLLSKARLNLAEQEMERMQNKASSAELMGQLAEMLRNGDDGDGKKLN